MDRSVDRDIHGSKKSQRKYTDNANNTKKQQQNYRPTLLMSRDAPYKIVSYRTVILNRFHLMTHIN